MRSTRLGLTVMCLISCRIALAQQTSSAELAQWKSKAESDISRIRMLATTTSFGGIKVSVPGHFRQWMPVNAAAQAEVAKAQGKKAPPVPQGETPVYIQFTKFGVKGLSLASAAQPFEWIASHNTPELKLDPHWVIPEVLNIQQFTTEFTVRVGNGRGISPRFDLMATLEDASIPCDIHALSTTCLEARPAARAKNFKPGRLTLESRNLPLPRKAQRDLSQSLTADVGPEIVLALPNQIFQMPTPEQFLSGDIPPPSEDTPTTDSVENEAKGIIDGLRDIIDPHQE